MLAWLKRLFTNSWMTNDVYIAFMAHSGWACLIVLSAHILYPSSTVYVGGGVAIFAALKEYVYDANFELPTQTFRDNTEDFLGYLAGLGLAAIVLHFGQLAASP